MADFDFDALLPDPRIGAGKTPVGETGGGEDLRDDPDFDQLEAEFRKTETDGPGAVNWKSFNSRSFEVLEKRSKDLVVASRLVYGLYRDEGYNGLAVGVSLLLDMTTAHWENLFPPIKRERGRVGSFDWIAEKLAPMIEATPPAEEQKVFALIAYDRLVELDDFLSGALQKSSVAIGPLMRVLRPHASDARKALEAVAAAASQPEETAEASKIDEPPLAAEAPSVDAPAQAEAAAAPRPAPAVSASAVPAMPDISLENGADKAFQSMFSAAMRLASAARQETPTDPRAYLASRFAAWGNLRASPPNKAGKTALPPPQKNKLAEIQALQTAGNHLGLLHAAESTFVTSLFWLDAQRLSVEAMAALGGDFDLARKAVIGELQAVMTRLPGLAELSFSDGTPFAEAETRSWISKELSSGGAADAGGQGDHFTAAVTAAQAGQVDNGLTQLTDYAGTRSGDRERFLAQLDIGEFCLRFGLLQPLLALLETMLETSQARDLGQWEPALVVKLASLSWRTLTHKDAKQFMDEKTLHERKGRILGQLARYDIAMAVGLSKP